MCLVDLETDFDMVPRKVLEWAMRKKIILHVLIKSVMSLNEGAKTIVRVDSELSEEFEAEMGMHQGSVLSPFLFAVVVDVVTDIARESALSQLLYTDDLDLYIFERSSTMKIDVERVNQEKGLVEFAGYITLAGNQK